MLKLRVLLILVLFTHFSCFSSAKKINPYAFYENSNQDEKIHLIGLKIGKFDMFIERARNGRETVSSIAKRVEADIAINAGFFHEDGTPAGLLKINGDVVSCGQKKNRGALMWSGDKVLADRVYCQGNTLVSDLGTLPNEFQNMVGGVPLILFEGEGVVDNKVEKAYPSFIEGKHARTAIGVAKDRLWVLIVEGSSAIEKKKGIRKGYSIRELEGIFREKNCDYAVNLDGGGSTTLVIDGKVVNGLEKERPVSEAIIFKRKANH